MLFWEIADRWAAGRGSQSFFIYLFSEKNKRELVTRSAQCYFLLAMSTHTRTAPPRPVLFTKANGPDKVLDFKITKAELCRTFAFETSYGMSLSLQKSEGKPAITVCLHRAKVSSIYDLGPSGFAINFEERDDWKLRSSIFMDRQAMEELRDKLNAFLG